ncbi:hypothetical protein [Streptomyces sp. NPDC127197]|uniref:hypothetical protein n=1 Tax=Streptomyces sp. NPDC127197 TaxID=3345388 RepID=UPI00362E7EEA
MRPEIPSLDLRVAAKDERYLYGVKLDLATGRTSWTASACSTGPGWYPFHEHVTRREKDPTAPRDDREVPTDAPCLPGYSSPPDVEHFSWRNEYVQLTPVDHRVEARLHLYVGKEQAHTLVRTVTLEIDLRAKRVMLPARIPAALRHQAEVKGRRILDLLLAARRERARGASEPRAVLGPWDRRDPDSADT